MPAPSPTAAVVPPPNPPKPAPKPKGRGKWLWIIVALFALGGGGGGGWWWWQHAQAANAASATKASATKPRAQAQYYALEPTFVVNLTDPESVRYLQADLQLMTRDDATLAALDAHAPAIRNRLLLLFGQHSAAQLAQRSGKERLQEAALAEVRRLLRGEGAPDQVEAVIFTSLVTQ